MNSSVLKAISWPLRFLLVVLAKSVACVGFSYFCIEAMTGHGSPSYFLIAAIFGVIFGIYSYADGDKYLLQVSHDLPQSKSIKNLFLPCLIAAFTFTIINENQSLLAINNIQSWPMGLYLFLVLSLIKGVILCIAMETVCAAESYDFDMKVTTILAAIVFGIGFLAVIVSKTNEWQLTIFIATASFIILMLAIKTKEALSSFRKLSIA